MANILKRKQGAARKQETAAEQVVARLDTYSQDEHLKLIDEARKRNSTERTARQERARAAALRLRNAI